MIKYSMTIQKIIGIQFAFGSEKLGLETFNKKNC